MRARQHDLSQAMSQRHITRDVMHADEAGRQPDDAVAEQASERAAEGHGRLGGEPPLPLGSRPRQGGQNPLNFMSIPSLDYDSSTEEFQMLGTVCAYD